MTFAILHAAGTVIATIAKGTLPRALVQSSGRGTRLGGLNAPTRVLQAAAVRTFGTELASRGWHAT